MISPINIAHSVHSSLGQELWPLLVPFGLVLFMNKYCTAKRRNPPSSYPIGTFIKKQINKRSPATVKAISMVGPPRGFPEHEILGILGWEQGNVG